MTDLELVNIFLQKENLTEVEKVIKEKCLELDSKLNDAKQEYEIFTKQKDLKQSEVIALSQQLEGVLQVIVGLSKKDEDSSSEESYGK